MKTMMLAIGSSDPDMFVLGLVFVSRKLINSITRDPENTIGNLHMSSLFLDLLEEWTGPMNMCKHAHISSCGL